MKTVLVLLALAMLAGCSNFPAVSAGVAQHSAEIADQELVTAEWALCKAATVGAWQRAYGNDPVKREGWQKLCTQNAASPLPVTAIPVNQ